ncbi:MAG: type II toxin-antitoxin system RelE/ParE family toxin [Brevundimonas sp.]|uniref:type II toxin-antitoxin system RelE/ParE family toxin n=1 Tax=Brevundimonas sp. TaxID=1871086 RepID=UPI0017EC7A1F|nr:type II toxin-antitoxin system RelE/ParE family toxin [Brevundimonas sp.]MBA4805167.1 type II toxin-antitoxin system RelE/ParE family toxin [Brevundimonas sp.]
MIEVRRTELFDGWLRGLRDRAAAAIIARRIHRLAAGAPGDLRPVGAGVSELRIHHGPGYRIYLVRRGKSLIVLLCGGDKNSQSRDIARSKQLAKEVR